MITRKNVLQFISIASLLLASEIKAASNADYPTFLFDVNYSLTSMKSKLVTSNDTGTSLNYGIGGFAGSDRQLEYKIAFESDQTNFQLNSSKITYDWQDTKLNYHLGFAYAGLIFSRLTMTANRSGTDLIDAAGSGYGGSLGVLTQIGKRGLFRFDVSSVSLPELKNTLATTASVPSRLDIDIGASVDMFGKWSFFNFGYKMRTLTVKADLNATETEAQTYVGIRLVTP